MPKTGSSWLLCDYPPQRILFLLSLQAQMPSRTTGPGLALFPASRSVSCQADCLPAEGKHSLLMHPTAAALLSLHSSSLKSGSPHTGGDGGLWGMQMPCSVLMVSSCTSSQEVILHLTKKPQKTKTQTSKLENPQTEQVQESCFLVPCMPTGCWHELC